VLELNSRSKVEVLRELVDALCNSKVELDSDEVVRALLEREKLGSTGIGEGVAIPHAKVNGLKKVVGTFGRSTGGVDFDALDGMPVNLFFLLLAPADSAGEHLKALEKASKILKDPSLRERNIAAKSRDEVFKVMEEVDKKE